MCESRGIFKILVKANENINPNVRLFQLGLRKWGTYYHVPLCIREQALSREFSCNLYCVLSTFLLKYIYKIYLGGNLLCVTILWI